MAVEHLKHGVLQAREGVIQNRAVERFLIFEVVVEQGLVDAGLAGDGVGAGSGYSVGGELVSCGLENRGAALLGLAARAHAVWGLAIA